jgi:hypothetical protein
MHTYMRNGQLLEHYGNRSLRKTTMHFFHLNIHTRARIQILFEMDNILERCETRSLRNSITPIFSNAFITGNLLHNTQNLPDNNNTALPEVHPLLLAGVLNGMQTVPTGMQTVATGTVGPEQNITNVQPAAALQNHMHVEDFGDIMLRDDNANMQGGGGAAYPATITNNTGAAAVVGQHQDLLTLANTAPVDDLFTNADWMLLDFAPATAAPHADANGAGNANGTANVIGNVHGTANAVGNADGAANVANGAAIGAANGFGLVGMHHNFAHAAFALTDEDQDFDLLHETFQATAAGQHPLFLGVLQTDTGKAFN